MLRIHNSLTGVKEPFRPVHPGRVGMYVCGVTVYNYCHVGHARFGVVFDVVRRWLRRRGYAVTYVRNITDIDDKIIRRAAESGQSVESLAAHYTRAMHEDFAALDIEPPEHEPRASAYMPEIIAMIERLIERGFAYRAADGDVLYAVARFPGYGRLSGERLEQLRAGARVEVDHAKRDPLDFVLWKHAKPAEPSWPSPWGAGRPGWHIECSAMAEALLGVHFDLHGGGLDLMFPHHENEIAQSCAASGAQFVNVWMHNGLVTIDDEKMSKSLGNFFTVREVLPHLRHPEVMRAFLLASHYRGPINYSSVQLEQADAMLARLYTALRGIEPLRPAEPGAAAARPAREHAARFEQALDDDFNTPEALAALQGLARALNSARAHRRVGEASSLAAELRTLGGVLGLLQQSAEAWLKLAPARAAAAARESAVTAARLAAPEIEALIAQRREARATRDFAAADRLRARLACAGVELEDHADGTTSWRRE